jgi:hypothetical protein
MTILNFFIFWLCKEQTGHSGYGFAGWSETGFAGSIRSGFVGSQLVTVVRLH